MDTYGYEAAQQTSHSCVSIDETSVSTPTFSRSMHHYRGEALCSSVKGSINKSCSVDSPWCSRHHRIFRVNTCHDVSALPDSLSARCDCMIQQS
ncbi:hypothetical protein TNCV_990071 [Trichonephila clavipes]|nr:hypothetical protein TNCV_990071 [Trichonephila clavipes]